jgi:hypothetical protein
LYRDAKKIVFATMNTTDPFPTPNQTSVSGTQAMPAIACKNGDNMAGARGPRWRGLVSTL